MQTLLILQTRHGFQSTPPRGGATEAITNFLKAFVISIHAPARGGDEVAPCLFSYIFISIHAPARGGDPVSSVVAWRMCYFNPRPREGGRHDCVLFMWATYPFQSTPPRGGATNWRDSSLHKWIISIHAPARGGDLEAKKNIADYFLFQSTPPRGGATRNYVAPRLTELFQSTPPRGGATIVYDNFYQMIKISIHAPARGGDSKDAQFYLRIFDKQVELLRFWGKMRGGCLRNPEKDRRFLGKSLANLPEISGHLDFAGA